MQNFSHFHPTLAGPFSDQAGPSGILSNRPDSPASVVTDSDSPTSSISSEGLQETQKKHYDKWPQEEQRALVSLWAERHELLESKDARKVWEEIARELNRKFGTKRTGDKCKKKMNYLIERYKMAKDWNSKQTGGHRRQSVFYEEIDSVLGCRDVVTLQHVAEAGTSEGSAANKSAGEETSPEARTDRKKKRKRARSEEKDEERELIKSSMVGMDRQRQDMNRLMENFTAVQQQQANNMNLLVGALTTFLQNNANSK